MTKFRTSINIYSVNLCEQTITIKVAYITSEPVLKKKSVKTDGSRFSSYQYYSFRNKHSELLCKFEPCFYRLYLQPTLSVYSIMLGITQNVHVRQNLKYSELSSYGMIFTALAEYNRLIDWFNPNGFLSCLSRVLV